MAIDWEQYRVDDSSGSAPASSNIDWEQYRAPESNANKGNVVPTWLGQLPGNPFKVPLGSQQSFINPEIIQGMINTGAGQGGIEKVAEPIIGLAKGTFNTIKNTGANLSPLEQKLAEMKAASDSAQQAAEAAKAQATTEAGTASPERMQFSKTKAENELGQIPEQTVINSPEATARNLDQANTIHEAALNQKSQLESALDQKLNKSAAHDVRAAGRIDAIQNATKKQIGSMYDEVESSLAGKNIEIKNPQSAGEIAGQLKEIISKGGLDSPEAKQVAAKLANYEQSMNIPARDYLASYRTVRDLARQANQEAYRPGITDEARQAAKAHAAELDQKAEEMRGILENGIGPEDAEKLKSANTRWANEVVPLYKNPVYNQIHFKGRMPSNIVQQLRGTDKGNVLLRNIIKNDPEALQNVIGQRYSVKPNELHEPNENMQEYLDAAPDIKQMLDAHKKSSDLVDLTSNAKKQAETQHKNALSQYEERQKNESKRSDLQKKINLLDSHIANLEKTRSMKNITLSQKMKAENELDSAKKAKEKALKTLKGIGKYALGAAGLYGAGKAINIGSNLINNADGEE